MLIVDDVAELDAAIERITARVLDRFGDANRIAYTEPEAASLFGFAPHVVRDARIRGELKGSKLGKKWCYSRAELLAWFNGRGGNREQ